MTIVLSITSFITTKNFLKSFRTKENEINIKLSVSAYNTSKSIVTYKYQKNNSR